MMPWAWWLLAALVGFVVGAGAALVWVRWMLIREAKQMTDWKGM